MPDILHVFFSPQNPSTKNYYCYKMITLSYEWENYSSENWRSLSHIKKLVSSKHIVRPHIVWLQVFFHLVTYLLDLVVSLRLSRLRLVTVNKGGSSLALPCSSLYHTYLGIGNCFYLNCRPSHQEFTSFDCFGFFITVSVAP